MRACRAIWPNDSFERFAGYGFIGKECWLGLFEQIFGIAKWNACRV
jgi:hypothetical protein